MNNRPRMSFVVGQMLGLSYEPIHVPFLAWLRTHSAGEKDGVAEANSTGTADSRHLGNRSDPSMGVEAVPMPHLFLLDMMIGR
jgi:hypothetical protein